MLNNSQVNNTFEGLEKPPKQLFVQSQNESVFEGLLQRPRVAIVGSRKVSNYGQEMTHTFATELARQGIVIVSGLALGIDAIAHKAALEAGGATIAVLPCGIDTVYPATNRQLARKIIEQGGALCSEHDGTKPAYKASFLERNRLIAGLSQAVILTEAAERSGSLNTARHAKAQGVPVFAVPGNLNNPLSTGVNLLIQRGDATLLTSSSQITELLGIASAAHRKSAPQGDNPIQTQILALIHEGMQDGGTLQAHCELTVSEFSQHMTLLELKGIVRPLGANQWSLAPNIN